MGGLFSIFLLQSLHRVSGDDGLARLVEEIVNQILDAQATEQLRAKPYERTEERQGYRNGHRDKLLKSRIGELTLMVPRLRSGYFSTELFERYQRSEQALLLAMVEIIVNGVSTPDGAGGC